MSPHSCAVYPVDNNKDSIPPADVPNKKDYSLKDNNLKTIN